MTEMLLILSRLVTFADTLFLAGRSDEAHAISQFTASAMSSAARSIETLRQVEIMVETMVREDRSPTADEWALLRQQDEDINKRFEALREARDD